MNIIRAEHLGMCFGVRDAICWYSLMFNYYGEHSTSNFTTAVLNGRLV